MNEDPRTFNRSLYDKKALNRPIFLHLSSKEVAQAIQDAVMATPGVFRFKRLFSEHDKTTDAEQQRTWTVTVTDESDINAIARTLERLPGVEHLRIPDVRWAKPTAPT